MGRVGALPLCALPLCTLPLCTPPRAGWRHSNTEPGLSWFFSVRPWRDRSLVPFSWIPWATLFVHLCIYSLFLFIYFYFLAPINQHWFLLLATRQSEPIESTRQREAARSCPSESRPPLETGVHRFSLRPVVRRQRLCGLRPFALGEGGGARPRSPSLSAGRASALVTLHLGEKATVALWSYWEVSSGFSLWPEGKDKWLDLERILQRHQMMLRQQRPGSVNKPRKWLIF